MIWEDEHLQLTLKKCSSSPRTWLCLRPSAIFLCIGISTINLDPFGSIDLKPNQPRHQFRRVGCFETHHALWSAASDDGDESRWLHQDLRAECGDDAMGGAKVRFHQHVAWPFTATQIIPFMFWVVISLSFFLGGGMYTIVVAT